MKKILITGNPNEGLAKGLASVFPNANFVSRNNVCFRLRFRGHLQVPKFDRLPLWAPALLS